MNNATVIVNKLVLAKVHPIAIDKRSLRNIKLRFRTMLFTSLKRNVLVYRATSEKAHTQYPICDVFREEKDLTTKSIGHRLQLLLQSPHNSSS